MKSFIPHAAMVHTHSFSETQSSNESVALFPNLSRITEPITLVDDEVVRLSAIPLRPAKPTGPRDAFS